MNIEQICKKAMDLCYQGKAANKIQVVIDNKTYIVKDLTDKCTLVIEPFGVRLAEEALKK